MPPNRSNTPSLALSGIRVLVSGIYESSPQQTCRGYFLRMQTNRLRLKKYVWSS